MILYYLLISILPLALHPFWTMFVGEMTMIKYVGAACLFVALVHLAARGVMPSFLETPQARWFLVLLAIVTASAVSRGVPFSWEHSPLISYVSFSLFFVTTISLVDTADRLKWSLLVAIGSVAWASLYVLREFQKYGGRPGWVLGDPNYYTISSLVVIPLAYFFVRQEPPGWLRRFCLGSLVLILIGVTLAASRGGLIGLSVSILYVVVRSGRRTRDLCLFLGIAVPILLGAPDSPVRRLLNPDVSDQASTETRQVLWAAGWEMIQRRPLIGVGLGNFKAAAPFFQDTERPQAAVAHNTYIEMAAETGLPGLLAFVATLGCTFRSLGGVRRAALARGHHLLVVTTSGLQAGLLGFAANAIFVSAQYQKLLWLMIFVSMCLPRLLREAEWPVRQPVPLDRTWSPSNVAMS